MHVGFDKLAAHISQHEGIPASRARAIAAVVGRKKVRRRK